MVFTTSGKTEIAKWLVGESSTAPAGMAVGTGTTSASITDTSLVGEIFRESFASTDRTDQLIAFEMTIGTLEATGSTLAEVGLFNSAVAGGTMFTRNTFAPISKTSNIEIQITNRIQLK